MKKIVSAILLIFCTCHMTTFSQVAVDREEAAEISVIPGENVFVHYNTSLLLSGEYLYFKVYVRSAASGLLSPLSKIAFVELVGEDGNRVFRQKILLSGGTGRGDFFLPTSVPSGNYKLLGYTHWMLNGEENNFFSADIAIVNPYRGDQSAVLPEEDQQAQQTSGEISNISSEGEQQSQIGETVGVELSLSGRNFGKREPVILKLNNPDGATGRGKYSISVRKKVEFEQLRVQTSLEYFEDNDQPSAMPDTAGTVILPDLRGDLLWGRIAPKNSAENAGVRNKRVALSIPGENYVVQVAETNEKGEFFFNLKGDYPAAPALFQVLGEETGSYNITIAQDPEIDHTALQFNQFQITRAMEEKLVERSVHNQIENAYYGFKPDTLLNSQVNKPFYEIDPVLYDLDDFTRFPSLRETFIEIIPEAYVRNIGADPVVRVRGLELASDPGLPPLLLVDGVVVQDHAAFLNIPAVEIQSIGVIQENYYLGPQIFQGIIDVTTVNGTIWETYSPEYVVQQELETHLPPKRYFRQNYTAENMLENIPDFRYQLLWAPEVVVEEEEINLEFFTSDISGEFEIHLEGYTAEGTPVSLRENFVVREE